jgi:ferredoxin
MREKPQFSFIKPSTRRFIQEARSTEGYSLFDLLHGYIYARWPYLYIGIGTGEHPLTRTIKPIINSLVILLGYLPSNNQNSDIASDDADKNSFADTYHGKVISLESAKQLVTVREEISIPDLEHVIPYQQARDIILQDPDHIIVLRCPCRSSRPDPCQPLDVCLIVGEPFASFVLEHHPNKARSISPDEAVDILKQENDRGHVHHAFFKDAMFGRFYAICNCCSCCCGAMQAHRNGTPMLASSGYVVTVDSDVCIGCSTCEDYCQFGALQIQCEVAVVDVDTCMGCGVCVDNCDQGALSLKREPSKGEPLILSELIADL